MDNGFKPADYRGLYHPAAPFASGCEACERLGIHPRIRHSCVSDCWPNAVDNSNTCRSPRGDRLVPLMEWFLYDNFNPRSPRGERHSDVKTLFTCDTISIHAPREGSDQLASIGERALAGISIHAPREGSDTPKEGYLTAMAYFNPRSPRGERR